MNEIKPLSDELESIMKELDDDKIKNPHYNEDSGIRYAERDESNE